MVRTGALILTLLMPTLTFSQDLTISQTGDLQTIYSWKNDRCGDEFIPDAPARAFRRADGKITLIATHRENWSLIGIDFSHLKPNCKSILSSSGLKESGVGNLWIEATYTIDGINVAALVSEDLGNKMKEMGCDAGSKPGRCWINNIIHATSSDMGQSFKVSSSASSKVATLSNSYTNQMDGRYGVFTTSNLVKKDNYYYMIAWTQGGEFQKMGNCIFRTADPLLPTGWFAWNGFDFSIDMSSSVSPNACQTLSRLPNEVRSISYIPKADKWLAVFSSRQKIQGDQKAIPGFYFSESKNLVSWSSAKRIIPAPTKAREEQPYYMYAYPSLIDPQSLSRNFETLDSSTAILLFTKHHLKNGNGTMNRDLVFVPVMVQ